MVSLEEGKVNFEKWLEALRSGEYDQARGRLMRNLYNAYKTPMDDGSLGYCCLGVACKVMNMPESFLERGESLDKNDFKDWFGIDPLGNPEEPAVYPYPGHRDWVSVATLNDSDKYTFEEIADALEATYMPMYDAVS